MSKDLCQALYRARATMAQATSLCSRFADAPITKVEFIDALRTIDTSMQNGVEDADRALIEYEQTHIFHLWVCPKCGSYQLPEYGEEGAPECHHGFDDSEWVEMDKVMVERMD